MWGYNSKLSTKQQKGRHTGRPFDKTLNVQD